MSNKILFSFDVEEFDIPLEYGQSISMAEQLTVGKQGLDALMPLLEKYPMPSTLFTTANFAQHFPEAIKNLSQAHEIASHTFYHSAFEEKHLLESRILLEQITGKTVSGLRMPRMKKVEMSKVFTAGYLYDSSVNPTYLPGRYNNFHLPRTIYTEEHITRIPASVSPVVRLPLFWLAFKNYPYKLFLKLCKQVLKKDGYLCLYFHPWEFTDISTYTLPSYVKKPDGKKFLEKLERFIVDVSAYGDFMTIENYLLSQNKIIKN